VNLAIIGTGSVGTALASALRPAGHRIVFGVRTPDPSDPAQASVADATATAEATLLATPFDAVPDVIAAAGGFRGQVLIDATNPLAAGEAGLELTLGHLASGAERIAALAPAARVVKAFNQTGFENLADARAYPSRPAMFIAGDDAEARQLAATLAVDAGFEAIDAGPLRAARLLEPLALLWIELARRRGLGPGIAVTLQRKGRSA
jgi:8-hydroxy-5-deazaflavin:NADPH oxidoreductase